MFVFKFGGASVKDAGAVQNVASILARFPEKPILLVVSAMGKSTNLLEEIAHHISLGKKEEAQKGIQLFGSFHLKILNQLFPEKEHPVFAHYEEIMENLERKLEARFSENFHFEYDQLVSLGEVMSSRILDAFLRESGFRSSWLDARKLIRTDHQYRDANVDWNRTEQLIRDRCEQVYPETLIAVTQGFIGHTEEGFTTTLGREGSDYTAGIFAYCLNAEQVTIWKDVPGMLNADPKFFKGTVKLDKISFKEAIELAYYGASVIHPKTIKPLQNKNIPLYVRSFVNPDEEGTIIQSSPDFDQLVPSYIFKRRQILFSVMPKDFSFLVEENLSDIFRVLSTIGGKINMMQNSALSFSFVLDQEKTDIEELRKLFDQDYTVRFNKDLELLTIRHYDQKTIDRLTEQKELLVQQKTRHTMRILMKDL
ncbi:MAG: aspartate kinase [Bacteroidetes bacterium]|nr:MAG: aspartate kinase [Bacteroidota bacterium]